MVLHSEIEKYLKEKPGSTVAELTERHYGRTKKKLVFLEGMTNIQSVLLDMIAEGKIKPVQNENGNYLLNRYYLTVCIQ
jgi:hypothetical protein